MRNNIFYKLLVIMTITLLVVPSILSLSKKESESVDESIIRNLKSLSKNVIRNIMNSLNKEISRRATKTSDFIKDIWRKTLYKISVGKSPYVEEYDLRKILEKPYQIHSLHYNAYIYGHKDTSPQGEAWLEIDNLMLTRGHVKITSTYIPWRAVIKDGVIYEWISGMDFPGFKIDLKECFNNPINGLYMYETEDSDIVDSKIFDGKDTVVIKTKNPTEHIKYSKLWIWKEWGIPLKMEFLTSDGNEFVVEYYNMEVNEKLDERMFSLPQKEFIDIIEFLRSYIKLMSFTSDLFKRLSTDKEVFVELERNLEELNRLMSELSGGLCENFGHVGPPEFALPTTPHEKPEINETCSYPPEIELQRQEIKKRIGKTYGFNVVDSNLCGKKICGDNSLWSVDELSEMENTFGKLPKCFFNNLNLQYIGGLSKGLNPIFSELYKNACCEYASGFYFYIQPHVTLCDKKYIGKYTLEYILVHEMTHSIQWNNMAIPEICYDLPCPGGAYTNSLVVDWVKETGWSLEGMCVPFLGCPGAELEELPPDLPTEWARKSRDPLEDMAESVALYVTNPNTLIEISPRRYNFVKDKIMCGEEYR